MMPHQPHLGIPQDRKERIVSSVAALLPISRCCLYDIADDLVPRGHVLHNGETHWIRPYSALFHEIDPFAPKRLLSVRGRRIHGTGAGDALQNIQKTDYYHGFMKPMGQVHKVDLLLAGRRRFPVAGLRLSRSDKLGPFTSGERSLLEKLMPLLELLVDAPEASGGLIAGLTTREQEIARLLLKGYTNKDICRAFDLQLPTVKTHLMNIFRKTGARNRADLVGRILA